MVIIKYKTIDKTPDLSHHGIKGQKWGVKNGPPYPLDYEDHSVSEKRLNSKSTIGGAPKEPVKRKHANADKEFLKKIGKGVLITAGVAALGAVAYSAISSGEFDNLIRTGKDFVKTATRTTVDPRNLGKSFKQIDQKMVMSINQELVDTEAGQKNCFCTSLSYCLNSLFGYNSKALGLTTVIEDGIEKYIDPVSGMKIPGGPTVDLYTKLFDGLKVTEYKTADAASVISQIRRGSTGIIRVHNGNVGHFLNYECDVNGIVSIIDAQNPVLSSGSSFADIVDLKGWKISHVINFAEATIREGIDFTGLIK